MPEVESLGHRIKRLRTVKDITQPELAQLIGVDSITISRWENDRSTPRGRRMRQALAQALETPVSEVMTGQAMPRHRLGARVLPERRTAGLAGLRAAVSKAQAAGDEVLGELIQAAIRVLRERGLV
jgi:transcriptional regulator with XRE-family HTH domain